MCVCLLQVGYAGPVSIAYQVSHDFRYYKTGIEYPEGLTYTVPSPPSVCVLSQHSQCHSDRCCATVCAVCAATGVYDGQCATSPSSVNHAVVAVGYGYDDKQGLPYWTVRNSWGTSFGMDGYFKIKRGVNKCGLADCASFPTAA